MHKASTESALRTQSPPLWFFSEREHEAQPAMLCLDAIQVSKGKKKTNPPCFHSSHVYINALMIPTSRLFLTPGLLPTPVCPSPASPHGNSLPFSSAAVVKHLAVNCHCHMLQALTIYPSWRRKAEMANCI